MANKVLLDNHQFTTTLLQINELTAVYGSPIAPAPFSLIIGEQYTVVWDGVEYECTAYDGGAMMTGMVYIGNGSGFNMPGDASQPFVIAEADGTVVVMSLLDTAANTSSSHTVSIAYEDVQYAIYHSTLTAIAKSIRDKTGTTEKLSPNSMPAAIEGISGGGGGTAEGCATMTFKNSDTVLFTRPVYIGDDCPDPITQGHITEDDVKKESTVDKVFTYDNGWSLTDGGGKDINALKNVTADRTVWAAYSSTPREHTITYYDDDGVSVLNTQQVPYGTVPSYTPTKEGAGFVGWTPTPTAVTGDASYTAVWSSVLYSGTLSGSSITWTIDTAGVLTLVGTGATPDYANSSAAPFKNYNGKISKIVVSDGITKIGERTLSYLESNVVVDVVMADSVTEVGDYAFNSTNLGSVEMSNSLTSIGHSAFNAGYKQNLTTLRIPEPVTWLGNSFVNTYITHLIFENPNGWMGCYNNTPTGGTALTADLSDPESAATAYKSRPNGQRWYRV